MPRGSWADKPEWQFINSNPNPRMRPAVMALMQKLREMRTFRHSNGNIDSAVVEMIADDLVHHYFVREGKIDQVFSMMMRMERYWLRMVHEIQPTPVYDASDVVMTTEMESVEGTLEFYRLDGGIADSNGSPDTAPELAGTPVGGTFLEHLLKENRQGIEHIIMKHVPEFNLDSTILCDCDRSFETTANWSKHLRIRIEKYLLNEFTPVGD